MAKYRSLRGTLATKAKETLFAFFGESVLPQINSSATPEEIIRWKKGTGVSTCYNQLFGKSSVLGQLFQKIFVEDSPPKVHLAFVMSIYATILDPKSKIVQLNESEMKNKVEHYLVSFFCTIL